MTIEELHADLAEKYAYWLWYYKQPSKGATNFLEYELKARRELWKAFKKYQRAYWKDKDE